MENLSKKDIKKFIKNGDQETVVHLLTRKKPKKKMLRFIIKHFPNQPKGNQSYKNQACALLWRHKKLQARDLLLILDKTMNGNIFRKTQSLFTELFPEQATTPLPCSIIKIKPKKSKQAKTLA